jgi:hypothetical protein
VTYVIRHWTYTTLKTQGSLDNAADKTLQQPARNSPSTLDITSRQSLKVRATLLIRAVLRSGNYLYRLFYHMNAVDFRLVPLTKRITRLNCINGLVSVTGAQCVLWEVRELSNYYLRYLPSTMECEGSQSGPAVPEPRITVLARTSRNSALSQ